MPRVLTELLAWSNINCHPRHITQTVESYGVLDVLCSTALVWFSTNSTSVYEVWLSVLSPLYSRSSGLGPNSLKSTNKVLFWSSLLGKSSCLVQVTPQASQKFAITHTRKPLKKDTIPQVSTAWLEDCGNFPDQYSPSSTQPMKIKTNGTRQMTQNWCGVFQLQKSCHLEAELLDCESLTSTVKFPRIVSFYIDFERSSGRSPRAVPSKSTHKKHVSFLSKATMLARSNVYVISFLLKYNATSVWSMIRDVNCHVNSVLMKLYILNDDSLESLAALMLA